MQKRVSVHTFAAFHYDVAYRKTFEGYLDMTLKIIDAGLKMLARHPKFFFVVEQVIVMREYLAKYPTAKAAVRKFAQEGRLIFAPGMFTMPDVNLPSGESFIRNFLIGRDWLQETLGVEPKICWMADIFGHHAQIPQLARSCGYSAYVFERGKNKGDDTLFWWQGIDGTRLLSQWQIDTYFGIGIPMVPYLAERGSAWMARFIEESFLDLIHANSSVKDCLLSPIGGDFRMPEDKFLDFVEAYNRLNRKYRIEFASPEKYFETVQRKHGNRLPVIRTDFNPLMQGTYSSRIRLKQANRRLENLAAALEVLDAAVADAGGPANTTSARLWEAITWNAFHDIICGSLEDNALKEALRDYFKAERMALHALSLGIVSSGIRGRAPSKRMADVVVSAFNSLPYAREELVEIPLKMFGKAIDGVQTVDAAGKQVECQLLVTGGAQAVKLLDELGKEIKGAKGGKAFVADDREATVLARIKAGPASVQTYGICTTVGRSRRSRAGDLKVSETVLDNRFLKAVFGTNGTIVSLIDKENDVELADPGRGQTAQKGMNNIMLQADMGDLWLPYRGPQNGTQLYATELRDPMAGSGIEYERKESVSFGAADADAMAWPALKVAETGPLRAAIEVNYRDTRIVTLVSLARDEKMLRFRTTFMPAGKRYRLRVAFPTSIRKGRIRTSIPCGHVERKEGEYAAQDWMDYADGKKGLCVLNRGLPGNNVTDGVMLLSLFRAVGMEDAGGQVWFEEGVEQVFEYAIRPFGPKDKDYHPARLGARFNRPIHTAFPGADGAWPELKSMIEVTGDHVELMAYRKVGAETEIRLYESEGKKGLVGIRLSQTIRSCRKTDVRGQMAADQAFAVNDNRLNIRVRPFEIVTLRVAMCGRFGRSSADGL